MTSLLKNKLLYSRPFRSLRVMMKKWRAPRIIDEDPKNAWPEKYINVKDRVVLDLGCGFFGRSEQVTTSTSEYFKKLGAKKVISIDQNDHDIEYLKSKGVDARKEFINHSSLLKDFILKNNVEVIKSDIEGSEVHFLYLEEEVFKLVREYYVETHDTLAFKKFMKKFKKYNYEIRHIMRQVEGGPPAIILAYRNHWV